MRDAEGRLSSLRHPTKGQHEKRGTERDVEKCYVLGFRFKGAKWAMSERQHTSETIRQNVLACIFKAFLPRSFEMIAVGVPVR